MMKFLSYATATSVALVALQGCKSESGPDAVYKGVKAASDTITKDGFAAKNVKDTYTNFEKSVKNVKKMDKKPEAEELKKYKITDMNAELVKMNTAFCTLDKTQAAANMKQYTAKIKAVLTWYDVQTYSCDVTPVTPTPIQKALEHRDNMVAQLKKAIADDKANETKYQAQIDILVKFDKDSKVDDINAAVTTAEGQLPTAQQDEIALKKQKTLIPGLIKKLEALTDKKAETTPLIADLNAALKMKVEDLNKVKKAVKAAKTFIDANKPVVVTPQSAFDKDSEDVEIIPADDKADQELRFKNLTEEQQKAEYEAMKGLEKSAKKSKYADLLVAAKKVLQDARKVVVDGVEGIDADHKNALIAAYNKFSLVAMTADDKALKEKVDAAANADAKKAATKQYFEDQYAAIVLKQKADAYKTKFDDDLKLKVTGPDAELSAEQKAALDTMWSNFANDQAKVGFMDKIEQVRLAKEAVRVEGVDCPVIADDLADRQIAVNRKLIEVYTAVAVAEIKKENIKKMNDAYTLYTKDLAEPIKTAETDRLTEVGDEDAQLAEFLTIDPRSTAAEVKTGYEALLKTFLGNKYTEKTVATFLAAPADLSADQRAVLDFRTAAIANDLVKRSQDYVDLKGKDAANVKAHVVPQVNTFVADWHTNTVVGDASELNDDEKVVEADRFAALAEDAKITFYLAQKDAAAAALKTDLEDAAVFGVFLTAAYGAKTDAAFLSAPNVLTADDLLVLPVRTAAIATNWERRCKDYVELKEKLTKEDAQPVVVAQLGDFMTNTVKAKFDELVDALIVDDASTPAEVDADDKLVAYKKDLTDGYVRVTFTVAQKLAFWATVVADVAANINAALRVLNSDFVFSYLVNSPAEANDGHPLLAIANQAACTAAWDLPADAADKRLVVIALQKVMAQEDVADMPQIAGGLSGNNVAAAAGDAATAQGKLAIRTQLIAAFDHTA